MRLHMFLNAHFPFVSFRRKAYVVSAIIAIAGIGSLVVKHGLRESIDFAGGTLIQVRFAKQVGVDEIRKSLDTAGLGLAEIQESKDARGTQSEMLIRAPRSEQEGDQTGRDIKAALTRSFGENGYEIRREELVGPKIGKELRKNATWATIISLGLILIYMSYRFDFRGAVAAVIATFHDIITTVGMLSLTNRELSLTVIAAILTLVGFSVNDTIVVFDRIREDRRLYPRDPLPVSVDRAINATLSRTVITSGTVFLTALCLFFLGGEVLHDFAFTLCFGIVVGTYSSIFVAAPIIVEWEQWRPRTVKTGRGKAGFGTRTGGRTAEKGSRRQETGARA